MKQRNLVIISNYGLYKKSGAAYSRINCYSKALAKKFIVHYLALDHFYGKSTKIEFERDESGGIFFTKSIERKESIFYRNFLSFIDFTRPIKLIMFFIKNYSKENSRVLLYTSNFPLFISVIFLLRFLFGYTVIAEKNELEVGIVLNSEIPLNYTIIPFLFLYPIRLLSALFIDILTCLSSSIIVISTNLEKLYNRKSSRIPILVDIERFLKVISRNSKILQLPIEIVYLGTITKKKDAIFAFLKAFASLNKSYREKFQVTFIGSAHPNILTELSEFLRLNGLENNVIFKRPISSESVPLELSKHDIALNLREKNLQTHFGFATKLGEYLAAGLPVLTTDISDNKLFLRDMYDSYFVSINIESIKSKMIEIVSNSKELVNLGSNALSTAENNFNYKIYQKKLREIFH